MVQAPGSPDTRSEGTPWRRAAHDNLSQRQERERLTAAVMLWLVRNTHLVIRTTQTHSSWASGLHPRLLAHRSRNPWSFLSESSNGSISYDIRARLQFMTSIASRT